MASEFPTPESAEVPDDRSMEYVQTAASIVTSLRDLVYAICRNEVAENAKGPQYNGWRKGFVYPNELMSALRKAQGRYEVVHYNGGSNDLDAASYFCSVLAGSNVWTISEVRVCHDGRIETRDYVFPPVGDPDFEPPFESVADDPIALRAVRSGIDLAVTRQ